MNEDITKLFITAEELPEPDTSHFLPWTLDMLYQVEPELKEIAARAAAQKRRRVHARYEAYEAAKNAAFELVGWYARDPRLRSKEAWDCFFGHILDQLKI